jgi:hypothetical protein
VRAEKRLGRDWGELRRDWVKAENPLVFIIHSNISSFLRYSIKKYKRIIWIFFGNTKKKLEKIVSNYLLWSYINVLLHLQIFFHQYYQSYFLLLLTNRLHQLYIK